jgi:aspartate/methionine/tyrosine aminotransferase
MASIARRFAARRLDQVPATTVWAEFTPLAAKMGAINLGQGFPAYAPDTFVLSRAGTATSDPAPLAQQYCRPLGDMRLVSYLQERYTRSLGRSVQPDEILVTNGVTQGLSLVMMAFINPGDEVLIFEPFFDLYENDINIAHGIPKIIQLEPHGTTANDWAVDFDKIRAAITPGKTKAILVNTPQNVPGKVWSRGELEKLADIAREHDLLVFSDEVYENFVYDGLEHVSIATLPGMWERTVTMCSAGKTLAVTGWKIGWTVAPRELTTPLSQVHAHQCFSVATPLQAAVGAAFRDADESGYLAKLNAAYTHRRALLCGALERAGLRVVMPQGSFFVLVDINDIDPAIYMEAGRIADGAPADAPTDDVGRDWRFCRWLTKEVGVAAIPCSAFCRKESRPTYDRYVRFAFCKPEEDIVKAADRLVQKLGPLLHK